MPKKREGEEQIRVHIWVFRSDWEALKALYSDNIGPSKFVRVAIRQLLKKVREKTNAKPATSIPIDLDTSILDENPSAPDGNT